MTMTRADFVRQAAEARKTMQELARLFPGCFHADGRAIVASAHFPRSAQPVRCEICQWRGRRLKPRSAPCPACGSRVEFA